jgi:copper chaperone NosL
MKKYLTIGLLFLLASCAPVPQDIHYGKDTCSYCMMTIVDKQHAAELVTTKGKAYKFDAIECMVRYEQEHKETQYAFALINDFNNPGTFIDAKSAAFLISQQLPSPMGAFLSAFASEQQAMQMQQSKGGTIHNWNDLTTALNLD